MGDDPWLALGPRRMLRDVGLIPGRLVAQGRASWLGNGLPTTTAPGPVDESRRAALAVAALFTTNSA